ncbi:MAG: hypothetical protein AB7Q17_15740 [Phycisphaerae bacterium]
MGDLADARPSRADRALALARPLAFELGEVADELRIPRPVEYVHDVVDGWDCLSVHWRYPRGGAGKALLSRQRLAGRAGDAVREAVERYEHPDPPRVVADLLDCLRAWRRSAEHDLRGAPTNAPPAAGGRSDELAPIDRALLARRDHPDWTMTQLARHVGVSVRTLQRSNKREFLKRSNGAPPPRGSKRDGRIEAEGD